MSKQQTIKRTVTVELSKKVDAFLEDFGKFVGLPVEDILRAEIEGVLESFYTGEFFHGWVKYAFEKHGVSKELGFDS